MILKCDHLPVEYLGFGLLVGQNEPFEHFALASKAHFDQMVNLLKEKK